MREEIRLTLNNNYVTLFLPILLLKIILVYMYSDIVWSDETYKDIFNGIDYESYMRSVRMIDNIRYFIYPVYLFFILFIITSSIYCGFFLYNVSVDFGKLLKLVTISYLAFLGYDLLKVIWFILIQPNYSSEDLINFSAFSINSILKFKNIPSIDYMLRFVNIFELAFIALTSYGATILANLTLSKSFKIIVISYGSLLLCFICFSTYLKFI